MALSRISKRGGGKTEDTTDAEAEVETQTDATAPEETPAPPVTGPRVVRVEDPKAAAEKISKLPIHQREYRCVAVCYFDGNQKPALPGSVLSGLSEATARSLLEQKAIEEIIPL